MVKPQKTRDKSLNFFLLKDSSKKKSKTKETFETTAISTGSTDTLRFTIRKTWEASDQANKKIASSKLFLLHLLIHTCTTQKDSINIYFVRTSPVISLLQFIFQQTFWCFSIIYLFFADSCFPVCLSLCPSASFKLVGCQVGGASATWQMAATSTERFLLFDCCPQLGFLHSKLQYGFYMFKIKTR